MNYSSQCPFCEQPVAAIVTEQGGADMKTTIVVYYHGENETHFVINHPHEDCPELPEAGITGS